MASAVPILASTLGSVAVAKIGKNQGWSPMLTGILSAGAGLGVGGLANAGFAHAAAKSAALQSAKTGLIPMVGDPLIAGMGSSGLMTGPGVLPMPSFADAVKTEFGTMFSEGGTGQNFLKSMGAQLVDAALADPPRKQISGGGGGGGGGAMAPAYSAGGSNQGQYKVIGGFPERRTTIEWQEVA
jgi:hypothetical protein